MVDNRASVGAALAQLNILVAKAHVAIFNRASRHLQVRGIRLVLDIRGGRKHLVHALKAGDGLLIRLSRVHKRLERGAEQRNVEREGRHIDRLQLALRHQPTT